MYGVQQDADVDGGKHANGACCDGRGVGWILLRLSIWSMLVFFFQAEDGIRDLTVTGVQTCALPICGARAGPDARRCGDRWQEPAAWLREGSQLYAAADGQRMGQPDAGGHCASAGARRSEERRVGKECRSRWSPDH